MQIQNYINGELVPPASGDYLENFEPATGQFYSNCPDSDERDVFNAVKAAQRAFDKWSNLPASERAGYLHKISQEIENQFGDLAAAESKDNGKPVSLARSVDIPRAVSNFRFFSEAITQHSSEFHQMENSALNYTLRNPIGVAACISPWNLPLYLFTWKIAPALATGNCVIAKPSEITPMTAFLLSKICQKIGLPAGVLNIVHGLGPKVGDAISRHPRIPVLTFTGSTKTGAEIAKVTAPMFKKLSLEMGGKNPNIIFADCDYEGMLTTTLKSSFANQGQICLCCSRIFVESSIYEKFKLDFVERTKRLKVGDPTDPESDLGAVVSSQHLDNILSYIRLAKEEGGEILCGGNRVELSGKNASGWFVEPTVIEGLDYKCRTNQEEIFGPVVTLTPFDSAQQVIEMANSTEYGLAATIWTQNLTRAHRLANQIQSGIIWVNCWLLRDLRTPFGGMKNSGLGREGGLEALHFFTEPKNVCVKL